MAPGGAWRCILRFLFLLLVAFAALAGLSGCSGHVRVGWDSDLKTPLVFGSANGSGAAAIAARDTGG